MGLRLVYHAGALGDFVTVLPAVSLWRRLAPHVPIAFLGRREHGLLAREAGFVDEVWDLDRADLSRLFVDGGWSPPPEPVTEALLFTGETSPLARNLEATGCRSIIRQSPFPPGRQSKVDYHLGLFHDPPEVEVLLAPLRRLAGRLPPLAESPDGEFGRTIVVHPGSGGRAKNWPLRRFRRVAERLREIGWSVLWCLGPAEAGVQLPEGGRRVVNPSLPRLTATLGNAALFLGNDSGVSHLAAAAGCPSVVLFGPSDERIWTPRGAPVRAIVPATERSPAAEGDLSSRHIEAIPVQDVLDAALKLSSRGLGEPPREDRCPPSVTVPAR